LAYAALAASVKAMVAITAVESTSFLIVSIVFSFLIGLPIGLPWSPKAANPSGSGQPKWQRPTKWQSPRCSSTSEQMVNFADYSSPRAGKGQAVNQSIVKRSCLKNFLKHQPPE
jgi:hypothetical protein